MSVDCISKDDLSAGNLPKKRNEIVLYSDDKNIVGTERLCYFTATNIWDTKEYYEAKVKISGILKEKTDNVYFSKEMCNMFAMHTNSGIYRICYNYDKAYNDYKDALSLIPVICDDLKENQVRLSYKTKDKLNGIYTFRFQDYDENGQLNDKITEQEVEVLKDQHMSTRSFMEVSEEFYYKYYSKGSKQLSIYISNYSKTDKVLRKLEKNGYKAISTYRISKTEYIEDLVNERLIIICISALGLIILILGEVLILRSLMKIRVKDYFVLKFIGMKLQVIKQISYYEIYIYSIISMLLTTLIMWILRFLKVEFISEIMWYYTFSAYLHFFIYNISLAILAVASFNHLLKGRLRA